MASRLPDGLRLGSPPCLLATWFGIGLAPVAPGSWASLSTLPIAWIVHQWLGPLWLLGAAALLFFAGWWASAMLLEKFGRDDPGEIVVDEVAGQMLTLAAAPLDLWYFAAGFVLFRLADIVKPWPVSWADRRKDGFGVMFDDVLAGLYALAVLLAARLAFG